MNPSERLLTLLLQLYPAEQVPSTLAHILDLLRHTTLPPTSADYFSERNVTLITYGDSLLKPGEPPLQTLHHFLRQRLKDSISTVHILPFYPYSSDDGFSVIDYEAINPSLGTWDDVRGLGADFRLMFDAVINHMSAQSGWFRAYLDGDPAYAHFFRTESPEADLRSVTRPRTSPLLTPFPKADGSTVHVWTTFSADQVDLDYGDPETLLRILRVLLFYVEQGAQAVRLDAIAYLWKEVGTTCIHLPQTHQVIQLIRAALDVVAPHVVLITETNVPHAENISYFGDGSMPEAQLVYNFTLPPLLFYSLLSGDAHLLAEWVNSLTVRKNDMAFFNFTASHDGIGVRPVEGTLSRDQIQALIQKVEASGGQVSYKANPDGSKSPYELNAAYLDAIVNPDDPPDVQAARFLVSQAIMLALAGVPAIYIHSLLGSHNDIAGMKAAGYPRAINRQKLNVGELTAALDQPDSFRARVFAGYTHLIRYRTQSAAFHPNADQRASVSNGGKVFALQRTALDGSERVRCLFNLTGIRQSVAIEQGASLDLLTGEPCDQRVTLNPYQVRWLRLMTKG